MKVTWWSVAVTAVLLSEGQVEGSPPIVEETKLVSPPPVTELIAEDSLGQSVAIDGEYCVTGVEADYTGINTGAVHVYRLAEGDWVHQAKLLPNVYEPASRLGASVSIDGRTIVAGAKYDGESGAVYVFRDTSSGGDWTSVETVRISSNLVSPSAYLGSSVSINGDTLIAGAPGDEIDGNRKGSAMLFHDTSGDWSAFTEIKLASATLAEYANFGSSVAAGSGIVFVGAPDDDGLDANTGAVYIYSDASAGGDWSSIMETKIVTSDGVAYDDFGAGVSFDGLTLAAGAPGHDAAGTSFGAVYIFRDTSAGGDWSIHSEAKLLPSTATRYLGGAVSIKGTTLAAAGGIRSSTKTWLVIEDTSPTGDWSAVNQTPMTFDTGADIGEDIGLSWTGWVIVGAPRDSSAGYEAGAVAMYSEDGGWHQEQVLTASGIGDFGGVGLGFEVVISGSVCGASVPGTNGSLGRVEIFQSESPWSLMQTVMPAVTEFGDFFGWSVALENQTLVAGAPFRVSGDVLVFMDDSFAGDWGTYSEVALTSAQVNPGDRFGWAVDLQARTVVAGAPYDDDVGYSAGAVYVFQDTSPGGDWSTYSDTKITASDGASWDNMGYTVAIDGRTIVAGTYLFSLPGTAYIFQDTSPVGDWSTYTETKISASNGVGRDHFGKSWVGVMGDTVAISATGADLIGEDSGAIYLYHDDSGLGMWDLATEMIITDPLGGAGEFFGGNAALGATTLAVGATERGEFGVSSGALVIYQDVSPGGDWSQILVGSTSSSDGSAYDGFGSAVDIDGPKIVVASCWNDASGPDNGAAYICRLNFSVFADGFESGDTSEWQ